MVTGAQKIIVSHSREFGTKQFLRVMYIVLSEFTVQDLGE